MLADTKANEDQPVLGPPNANHLSGWKHCGPPARYVFSVFGFLGLILVYALRVNLSVALVAMVNTTNANTKLNVTDECPAPQGLTQSVKQGEFQWDADIQGVVLGSFFYSYVIMQIPGGWMAHRWGGKLLFGLGVLCTGLLSMLTPIAARISVYLLIAVRILMGLGEGVTYPALNVCMSKWLPPLERTKLGMIIHSGAHLGIVIAFPASGALAASNFAGGWPSIFYVFGGTSCIWCVFWLLLVHESPAKHPRISKEERNYIETAIGHEEKYRRFPVCAVAKSPAVWAASLSCFGNNWVYYTLMTQLPTYLADVLKFDVMQNGLWSALPYVAVFIMAIVFGHVADYIRARGVSTTLVRKFCNTLGLAVSGISLVVIGFVGCNKVAGVSILLMAGIGIGMAQTVYINNLDMAPVYAGTLFALANIFGSLPGMICPSVAGAFTQNNSTSGQWQKVFLLSAGIDAAVAIIYIIFGSGEEQPWAKEDYQPLDKE